MVCFSKDSINMKTYVSVWSRSLAIPLTINRLHVVIYLKMWTQYEQVFRPGMDKEKDIAVWRHHLSWLGYVNYLGITHFNMFPYLEGHLHLVNFCRESLESGTWWSSDGAQMWLAQNLKSSIPTPHKQPFC